MSEPIEIILKQNHQLLRLHCGQCGDSMDIILDIEDKDKIHITIQESRDQLEGEDTQNFLTPVEIIV